MTLEEILNDDKNFTDDIEFTIKDQKVSLGGLRGMSKAQQTRLSEQLEAAKADRQSAGDLATKAATLYSQLQEAAKNPPKQEVQPVDDFEDAFWAPVKKRLSPLENQLKEATDLIKAQQAQLANAASIWAKERWRGQFDRVSDRLKKSNEYKDYDLDKVLKYATDHKTLDEFGFPSVEKAVLEMTKANEIEDIKKAAFEAGKQEGFTRGRLNVNPRPSGPGGNGRVQTSIDPENNLNDLADVVAADDELSQMLASIGVNADAGGIN